MGTSPLPRLCVGVVLGDWETVREVRRNAADGEPDRRWREAVLQTHLFAGFPRLVEAYGVLAEVGGLGQLDPGEAAGEPDCPDRGRKLFDRIYGDVAGTVRETLEAHHADFAAWVEGHAYGRVLARPGLSPARRELLAVVCLTALGQDRQLMSHARGALRCGASADELDGVLDSVEDLIDPGSLERARRIVARVRGELDSE